MSDEHSHKSNLLFVLLPPVVLCALDFFIMSLQPQSKAISHFSFAVLVAQLLCLLVFLKGKICPGQRGRLIKMNLGLLLYWFAWLFVSLFSNYNYVITDIVALCGIGTTFAIWQQPIKDRILQRSILILGIMVAMLGVITYLLVFFSFSINYLPLFNPFAQFLAGTILANLMLIAAENRLHNFMGLLPMTMLLALFLNAVVVLGLLFYAYFNAIEFPNELAWALYFTLHLLMLLILGVFLLKEKALNYPILLILLFISTSLPLWATFAYNSFK